MTNPNIDVVFDMLDDWRHLPDYQLERRADIYFALFLPHVLEEKFKTPINPTIIPEFPLRQKTSNRSDKADYLALSKNGAQAFLVELKTDMGSVNENQVRYLRRAAETTLRSQIDGIIEISKNTDEERKYVHLLERLSKLGLVNGVEEACRIASNKTLHGLPEALKQVNNNVDLVAEEGLKPKIIYILPNKKDTLASDFTQITFEKFAGMVKDRGSLGKRFAKSLMCWAEYPAGTQPPGAKCL